MVKRVVFGEVKNEKVAALADLDLRERINLGALAAVVLLFGLWPAPLVNVMHVTVENLVEQVGACKLPEAERGDCVLPRPETMALK
ncbi:NADH-quinone oxidoreductase subunit M [Allochromatium warmingii]|uniref:NADH-quinone oxidoreductase subunit M n=1 Tax=Allochromatium warmingii TaxID=61595 RepID=A0A1H3D6Y0_ALLWA|nr:NADH-quinone oxidoreductase subunit M [Allochromatium warmingii]